MHNNSVSTIPTARAKPISPCQAAAAGSMGAGVDSRFGVKPTDVAFSLGIVAETVYCALLLLP